MDVIHNNTFSKFKFTMIMDLLITMNSSIYRQSRIFSTTTTCILNYCEIVPSMQFKPSFFSSARKVIQYKWSYFPPYYKQVKRKLFAIIDNRNFFITSSLWMNVFSFLYYLVYINYLPDSGHQHMVGVFL